MPAHAYAAARTSGPAVVEESEDQIRLIGAAKIFGRDQEIYGEGAPADFVYRVTSGAVRCFRVLSDGRRQISDFYLPGDIFGVELDLEHRVAAEAIVDTVVIAARRGSVASQSEQGPRLWRHALCELRRSQEHVLTLGRRSAVERVASFLVDLARRTDAGDELQLPMSRQDIADYLGLTIETVSRTLTQMQSRGLIGLSGCRRVRLMRPAELAELCE